MSNWPNLEMMMLTIIKFSKLIRELQIKISNKNIKNLFLNTILIEIPTAKTVNKNLIQLWKHGKY